MKLAKATLLKPIIAKCSKSTFNRISNKEEASMLQKNGKALANALTTRYVTAPLLTGMSNLELV